MVREVPYTSVVISDIVQHFIQDIKILTIERFDRCARLLWNTPPYSGPIPAPYPMQPTSPIVSPPGSSLFTYYGKQNRAIIVDSDSDDDNNKPHSTTHSHRHEHPLSHLSNSSSSQPCPITPGNPHTTGNPRTPQNTQSKTQTPKNFISPLGTPPRYKSGPTLSQARLPVTGSAVRPSPENYYAAFIESNGLTELFPAINLVRRRVVMLNWKEELLNLGISQDLVADLMTVMNSYSDTECSLAFPSE